MVLPINTKLKTSLHAERFRKPCITHHDYLQTAVSVNAKSFVSSDDLKIVMLIKRGFANAYRDLWIYHRVEFHLKPSGSNKVPELLQNTSLDVVQVQDDGLK